MTIKKVHVDKMSFSRSCEHTNVPLPPGGIDYVAVAIHGTRNG
jgi:hypothetical protein